MAGRRRVPLGAAIAVGIVLASCASSETRSPGPAATTGPTDPGTTPTAASSPSTSAGTGTWTFETSLSSFEVDDLVSVDGRVVAVGCVLASNGCAGASIAVLGSGQWSSSTFDLDPTRLRLTAIEAGGGGLIAVGDTGDRDDPATWRAAALVSTDGRVWHAAPNQASFASHALVDVADLPGQGWVAVGSTVTPTVLLGFDSWFSRDGLAWELTASLRRSGVVWGVVAFDGGLIAWGRDCTDACGPPARATLWTSGDGRTWTRVPEQPSLTSADVDAVIPISGGAVAVGSTYDPDEGFARGVVWTTSDGTSWTQVLLPEAADYQFFRVIEGSGGVVAVGLTRAGNTSAWRTWHSADGTSWTRLSGTDVQAERLELVNVAGEVLAVAVGPATDRGRSYVLRLAIE